MSGKQHGTFISGVISENGEAEAGRVGDEVWASGGVVACFGGAGTEEYGEERTGTFVRVIIPASNVGCV